MFYCFKSLYYFLKYLGLINSWYFFPTSLWLLENMLTLKRYSKKRINELGKESQVFKEKELMKSLSGSSGVPQVLSTFSDKSYFGILLNSYIACSLSSVLHTPLEELSVRFCAASLVIALKELHQVCFHVISHKSDIQTVDCFLLLKYSFLQFRNLFFTEVCLQII